MKKQYFKFIKIKSLNIYKKYIYNFYVIILNKKAY